MSDYLPVPRDTRPSSLSLQQRGGNGSSRLTNLLSSPVARGIVDLMPDLLRLANRRRAEPEARSFVSELVPRNDGASGMTLSEVEVDIDAPFIRRVVIRSASSWSVSPEVIERQQQRRRGRFKLGAITVGALGLVSLVFARRLGYSIPADRIRPSRRSEQLATGSAKRNPGAVG